VKATTFTLELLIVDDDFIERNIITGIIVSREYIRRVQPIWDDRLIDSPTIKMIASWCFDYYKQYKRSPRRNIESIVANKIRKGMPKDQSEMVERILQSISDQFVRRRFNIEYLFDQTVKYFKEQKLRILSEDIQQCVETDDVLKAEQLIAEFRSINKDESTGAVNPFEDFDLVDRAFANKEKPIVKFPKAFGKFINDQMVRDAFISFMGIEKIGKTFMLILCAMYAIESDCNVVFFQAGDMSEEENALRLYIYLAKRSNLEKYCGPLYVPIPDCWRNQIDICRKAERQCDFGIWNDKNKKRSSIKYDELSEKYDELKDDYEPCTNCRACRSNGAVWFKYQKKQKPLTAREAWKIGRRWWKEHDKEFKLYTAPNETLSMKKIESLLDIWEKDYAFIPDVVIIDYMDLLAPDFDIARFDYRQQQNIIWQRARRLSQERHCLLITATQAAASGYKRDLLKMEDYSEDKRKYAHVTAMYGLNQSDSDKKIGIMRVNEMLLRQGDFDRKSYINLLQRLQMGRPLLASYF